MESPKQLTRFWLILPAVALALLGAAFYLQHQQQKAFRHQQLQHQSTLATILARDLQHQLGSLQQNLKHLSETGAALASPTPEGRSMLALAAEDLPGGALLALWLHDNEGNVLLEHPPNQLAFSGLPVHLLQTPPPSDPSPSVLGEEGSPQYLVFTEPFAAEGKDYQVKAVVDLKKLFAAPGYQADPLSALLIDSDGRVLQHPDPDQLGRPFSALFPSGKATALFHFMAANLHPAATGSAPSGQADLDSGPACARPVDLSGHRLTLFVLRPGSEPAAMFGVQNRLFWVLSLLLLSLGSCARPVLRFGRQLRRQRNEKQLLQLENGLLRQAAEKSRRRSEYLLENAGDAIFLLEPLTGSVLEANRQAEALLGYTSEEIRQLSPDVLFVGKHRRRYLRLVKTVQARGYGEEGTLFFRRRDGSQFIGSVHARLGDLGDRQLVHGVIRDVTSVKRTEDELRRKNKDLLLLQEITRRATAINPLPEILSEVLKIVVAESGSDGGGFYLLRHQGNELELVVHQGIEEDVLKSLLYMETGAGLVGRVAMSGHPRSSADLLRDSRVCTEAVKTAGWRGFQAVPLVTDRPIIGVLFVFSRRQRILTRDEVRLLLAIGRQLGAVIKGAQLFEALNWQCRLTEASNRELEKSRQQLHQNLTQLQQTNQVMTQLDRMKSHFLALASHELRTPLTYVLSGTELLLDSLAPQLDPEQVRTLEAIHQGGKRLETIVSDLLEAARIESKGVYLARQPVDLELLLSELQDEFAPHLALRQLSLRQEVLPPSEGLFGDPHHLKQTLRRLIQNAVKFTPEGGGIKIFSQVTAAEELRRQQARLQLFSPSFFIGELCERYLQLTVQDTGIGIESAEQVRIFDKFYGTGEIASHFTSQYRFGGKGVGLGLTLARGIIEAHGGMIWVESAGSAASEGGSAFHILMPLTAAAANRELLPTPTGEETAAADSP